MCSPEYAKPYLVSIGWRLERGRALRNGVSIPAPVPWDDYDLHDLACEERVGATELMSRIMTFAKKFGLLPSV